MGVGIRQGRPEDAEAASLLAVRAKASLGYPADWLTRWQDTLTIRPEYLDTHGSWMAERDGELVGICVLERRDQLGALQHVWVAPEFQRHGIGRALVREALAWAADAGFKRIEVVADPSAMPFYLRLGARRCGHQPAPMPGAPERALPRLEFLLDDSDVGHLG